MRNLFFSMCALAIAATAVLVWSHTPTPVQASQAASTINPAEMTANIKGSLPVEQWDAI